MFARFLEAFGSPGALILAAGLMAIAYMRGNSNTAAGASPQPVPSN